MTVISISPRRDLFTILFLAWWIALWVAGEATLIGVMAGGAQALLSRHVPNTISTFRYLWPLIAAGLVAWSVIGVAMIGALLGEIAGKQVVTSSSDTLSITRRFPPGLSEETYPTSQVRDLRIDATPGWWLSHLEFWGLGGGKIAFEVDGKTIRCARGIGEDEAGQIVDALRRHSII